MKSIKTKYFKGLTRNSILLTFTSFFADISTEMLFPVLPIFLTQVLFAPASIVGVVEGFAIATQNIIQGFSGRLADKIGNKKVALFGYAVASLAKASIGFASAWPHVLIGRTIDRLGTGTRSAPRDGLIAMSVEEKYKGKAFGIEGIGDNAGAVVGPLIAVALIYFIKIDLHNIFLLTLIPGAIAFCILLFVTEKRPVAAKVEKSTLGIKNLPLSYWKYLFAIGVAGIGNSSSAFLILKSRNIGIPFETIILIYAAFNFLAAASSYPAGSLSDKLGRRNILILALIIFAFTYFGFALSTNLAIIAFLFALYGIYQGIFRAVGKAMASDNVPIGLRSTGLGIYSTVIGLTGLFASITGGLLWDRVDPSATFFLGVISAILGIIVFLILTKNK